MDITEVKVRLWRDQRLRALVTVVFDDCFVVRNIKVIEGRDRKLFVAMPSRKMPDGRYGDIAHPITRDFRRQMETTILGAYVEECELAQRDPAYAGSAAGADDYDEYGPEDEGSSPTGEWAPQG
jgi:stage V sporulation protein G